MNRKLVSVIGIGFAIFMAVLTVFHFSEGNKYEYQITAAGIVLGLIPIIIERVSSFRFKIPVVLAYYAFLFSALYLGSVRHFYSLGWWDVFLHLLSGVLIGFAAFGLLERMILPEAARAIARMLVFLFVLAVAALGGVFWEIYEFSADHLIGTTTQGGGNPDTMIDLIADTTGGLAAAAISTIRWKQDLR